MIIHEFTSIDIETGNVIEDVTCDYHGPVAELKGSSVPIILPSKEENELTKTQTDMLKRQMQTYDELEPFMLESMGYSKNAETGEITKNDKALAQDLMLKKSLAMAGYDTQGNKLTTEQMQEYMTDEEKQAQQITKANNERLLKAYNGELDISPALESELATEEAQAEEVLRRKLGDDWALSTSGQSMMKNIKQKANLVREEARRGAITTGEGVAASRSNIDSMKSNNRSSLAELSSNITNSKLNQMLGLVGGTNSAFDNSMSLSSKLASDRANIQNSLMQQWATKEGNRNSIMGASITGGSQILSQTGGAAAGAAAAAAA